VAIVKLVLNIDSELHRRLKVKAAMEGITITKVVTDAIEKYVQARPRERRKKGGKE
jgi:predicted HicB family RNase H-like nuclease